MTTRVRLPREIWVLIAAAFIVALGYGIIAPILPQYAKSFDVSIAAASTIVSAFALMRMLFAPAGGALVTKLGERRVYLSGLAIVAISTGLCAVAGSFEQLLVVRSLGGVGSVMFTVSAMGLIVRTAPPNIRGRVSASYGTAFLAGNILGPVLGSLLSGLGYRIPFVIYAVALVCAVSVAAWLLPSPQAQTQQPDARPTLTFRNALRDPAYRALLLSNFAHGWNNWGVRIAILPLFAAAVPTLGAHMAGFGLTSFAIGNFLVLQVSGRLVDARGRRPVLLGGLTVSALATATLGMAGAPVVFMALSAIAGAGASLINPSQQAMVADIVGSDRSGGQALAAFSMASDLGGFIGPMAIGLIADALGFSWAFAITGMMMLAAGTVWLFAPETLHRRP